MQQDLWVPIVFFIAIAVVLASFFYFRTQARLHFQETLRKALDQGQELSPEIIERLAGPRPRPDADMRRGVIALALAAAVAVFALILGEQDSLRPLFAIASLPGLIGAAYLLLWKIGVQPAR